MVLLHTATVAELHLSQLWLGLVVVQPSLCHHDALVVTEAVTKSKHSGDVPPLIAVTQSKHLGDVPPLVAVTQSKHMGDVPLHILGAVTSSYSA